MKTIPGRLSGGIFFLINFFLITSCASTQSSSQLAGQDASSENIPRIIFLNFSIERNNEETIQIDLIDKIVTEGTMKMNITPLATPKEGDLRCMTLDGNKRPISTIIVPDPFIKKLEYQQEDGSLTSKQELLDRADFSVRMPLDSGSRYIAVERINPNESSYLLITEIN